MKTTSSRIRIILTTVILGLFASTVHAGPGIQYWKSLGNDTQFKQLKTGDTIVYVCNICKTVSEVPVKSQEQAMNLCKVGSMVTCPSCKMKVKVVPKRQRNDPATHTEVIYVNEKGEECGFYAKSAAKK